MNKTQTETHQPSIVRNTTGSGVASMVVCSCGWAPKKGPARMSTFFNGHMAHRRAKGLPRMDYSAVWGS